MPRVTLEARPAYEFEIQLTVRATDINYGGHLANEALLELVHEARVWALDQVGLKPLFREQGPVGLIIADLAVNFRAEAFAGDCLLVESQVGEVAEKSFVSSTGCAGKNR